MDKIETKLNSILKLYLISQLLHSEFELISNILHLLQTILKVLILVSCLSIPLMPKVLLLRWL